MSAALQNETHIDTTSLHTIADHPTGLTTDAEIESLRAEIDLLDGMILSAIERRTELSQTIGRARMAGGGTRLSLGREMDVLHRFSELGHEGHAIAMVLLRLGRGRIGK